MPLHRREIQGTVFDFHVPTNGCFDISRPAKDALVELFTRSEGGVEILTVEIWDNKGTLHFRVLGYHPGEAVCLHSHGFLHNLYLDGGHYSGRGVMTLKAKP